MKSILKVVWGSLISLAIVLTFSCIFQIVDITQDNYLAQQKQRKINTISRESLYSLHQSENSISLGEIEKMARERNFTDSEGITYLRVSSTEVVVR